MAARLNAFQCEPRRNRNLAARLTKRKKSPANWVLKAVIAQAYELRILPGHGLALRSPIQWLLFGNPKAILFFSSLLPQFVSTQQDSHISAFLPLILLLVFIKLIVSSTYALAAQSMATRLAKPGTAVWGKHSAGGVLMLFGIFMGITAFY
ncbi:LysE family translocator [Vreelandella sp. F11]|uniref:LysE family translocator n=1 Tax=Vreelandella sp. F11 TaxID=3394751 RepID=UPI0036D99D86